MDTKLKQLLKTIKLNESLLSMVFGVVTVLLIGVLVMRMYGANKPSITPDSEKTEIAMEKIGDVEVEIKDDGKMYPTELPETYKVEKGDHLWSIATKLYGSGYNWVDIAAENKLDNGSQIEVGQELKLPKAAVKQIVEIDETPKADENSITITADTYTVTKGDHLWNIAVRTYGDGYKWTEIAKANNIAHPSYIEVGQVIKLPR